ncbi:MAG TPA: zinc ribbon domain-containing protein [Verrucomicrobiae bacterium]|nr:zinc ribbon domain-containing protein [Verrucomicrobiae bacterium]
MSRFVNELKVIPPTARTIAAILYFGVATAIFFFALPTDPDMSKWPRIGQFAFSYGIMLFLFFYVLLIGYVFGDAKRRHMRYVMWTWLAVLIPNAIGIILYLILRDPLPKPCPNCSQLLKSGYTFCPHCGVPLQPTCPNCGRPVDPSWSHCSGCGAAMPVKPAPAA